MEHTEQATQPGPAPVNAPAPAPRPTTHHAIQDAIQSAGTNSQTFHEKLNTGEEHWKWKFGLRVITILIGIIGIGCMAWATANSDGYYYGFYSEQGVFGYTLITFTLSVVWCGICVLVLFLRRPPRPVHPGVAVGVDLVLWLAFIVTLLFCIVGVMSVMDFGSGGVIEDYSSSYGHYSLAPNGTWVYIEDEYYVNKYNYTRTCDETSFYGYGNRNGFSSCAEVDQLVNQLWQSKSKRVNTELTGTVCQGLALLLHFALFVWACVDTARRNAKKSNVDAEKLAAEIVMNMVRDGAIVQAPGASQQMQYPSHPQPAMTHSVPQGQYGQVVEHYGNEKRQV